MPQAMYVFSRVLKSVSPQLKLFFPFFNKSKWLKRIVIVPQTLTTGKNNKIFEEAVNLDILAVVKLCTFLFRESISSRYGLWRHTFLWGAKRIDQGCTF